MKIVEIEYGDAISIGGEKIKSNDPRYKTMFKAVSGAVSKEKPVEVKPKITKAQDGLFYQIGPDGTRSIYLPGKLAELVNRVKNDQNLRDAIIKYLETDNVTEAKEGKNLHLTHLEDLVFDLGYKGVVMALQYVDGVRDMLSQGGGKQRVTVKWDGAPAVFAGIDPSDGKFFVGTKSVFAKNAKLVKGKKSLDEYYGGTALHEILGYAFTNLKKLGIQGKVLQGDLLFSPLRPPEQADIDGENYLTFRPNTITYAVKDGTELASRIKRAKIGIVFHTTYEGPSVPEMKASFGADINDLRKNPDVWVEDAYYKDYTGVATLTDEENRSLNQDIANIKSQLTKLNKAAFDKFITERDLSAYLNQFMNARVRGGETVGDPRSFLRDFAEFYRGKMQTEIDKLRGGEESPAAQRRLKNIEDNDRFILDNATTLVAMLNIYSELIDAKLKLISKLNKIEGIGTFLKTDTGYKITNPEGFVAIGHEGGAVKLNDRLEFNRANFTLAKEW